MKIKLVKLCLAIICIAFFSCERDTYNAPDSTISGVVYDNEGHPIQVEQGGSSMVIRLLETGYDNPDPFDLNMAQDGSYINTKVFSGTYLAFPYGGPFWPIEPVEVKVKGSVSLDFTVVPYLKVEWVKSPEVLDDGRIRATFRFLRNNPPKGQGNIKPDLLDCQLFIAHTQYVGNNNYDNLVVDKAVSLTNDQENQTIELVSKTPMKFSRDYYVRIGVRVNDSNKKYNYTNIQKVFVELPE